MRLDDAFLLWLGLTAFFLAAGIVPRGAVARRARAAAVAVALWTATMLTLGSLGCGPREQALTAEAIAITVDSSGAEIARAEKADGLEAIHHAPPEGPAIDAALDEVRQRYAPVWASYDVVAAAHEAWRAYLLSGGTPGPEMVAAVAAALCSLLPLADEVGLDLAGKLAALPLVRPLVTACGRRR